MLEKLEKIIGRFTKGLYVSPEILENLFGVERIYPEFQFKSLALRDEIKAAMQEKGVFATVVTEKYGIKILTDREASEYGIKRTVQGLKTLEDSQKILQGVDVNNLESQEEDIHKKRIVATSRIVDAIKIEIKKDIPIKLNSYGYRLPKLL